MAQILRATAVPAGAARVLAMAILSVRPSVCPSVTTRYGFKAGCDRDSGSSPYDSLESLVSKALICVPLGEEIPLERGHQREVPPFRNRSFTTIGSSGVKTVADRHRLAAYLS